jgi:hypothetical protein
MSIASGRSPSMLMIRTRAIAGFGVAVGSGVSVGASSVNVLVGGSVTVDVGGTDVAVGDGGATTPHPANRATMSVAWKISRVGLARVGFFMAALKTPVFRGKKPVFGLNPTVRV